MFQGTHLDRFPAHEINFLIRIVIYIFKSKIDF